MNHLSLGQLAFLLVAGLLSGAVNAVAGGGSLLVFPALLAVGMPPLAANVTNSVVQWPGYAGIVLGVRADLRGQRARVLSSVGVVAAGSAAGCALLLLLPGAVFDTVVPTLVLAASALLALGPGSSVGSVSPNRTLPTAAPPCCRRSSSPRSTAGTSAERWA